VATTYSTARSGIDQITSQIQQNRKRLDASKATVTSADADLAAMVAQWTSLCNDIDAALAATPTDAAWGTLKAAKDLLVAEFNTLKAAADAFKAAADAITY
jgi:hypothetical protein